MSLAPSADRPYFAAFLDLRGKPGVLVGGGGVASAKAEALLRSGIRLTVVAPELCARLAELALIGAIRHEPRRFQPGDLIGADIVVAATDDPAANESVSTAARALRIPVNVVDNAALSTFIMPAVIDRPPMQIAVSTGGAAPVLARKVRTLIEAAVPFALGRLAAFIGRFRGASKARIADAEARRRMWEQVVDGPIAEMVLAGNDAAAAEALEARLADASGRRGFVSLVGAGPGDPGLLTLRALRCMQSASVVLYDHLVSQPLVDLVRRDARRIYVGKQQDRHALPQQEINALMVRLASEGERVVRLKGGDPFIFGRGGEEIEALRDQGIAFEVVPGVTAAAGAASYAGIPLTHRDYAQSCLLVTGHLKNGSADLDWQALARPRQTLVVYMGVGALEEICDKLVCRGGMAATMPAAVVERATLDAQRVVAGTLETLPALAAEARVGPPALLIVGEVVKLRARLGWFEPAKAPATA